MRRWALRRLGLGLPAGRIGGQREANPRVRARLGGTWKQGVGYCRESSGRPLERLIPCPRHVRGVAGAQSIERVLKRLDRLIAVGERIVRDTERALEKAPRSGKVAPPPPYDAIFAPRAVEGLAVSGSKYAAWRLECHNALVKLFGTESDLARAFQFPMEDSTLSFGKTSDFRRGKEVGLHYVRRMVGVLLAAKSRLVDDPLFSLRRPILAGFLTSVINGAKDLLAEHLKDAAAMCGRVALEGELRERAAEAGVAMKKDRPVLSDFNDALLAAGALKKHEWLQIKSYADVGNAAAHGKFDEYTEEEVRAMLEWIGDFASSEEGEE